MNKNYIIVKNTSRKDIELSLKNLIHEYTDYKEFNSIRLYKLNSINHTYLLDFEIDPNFEKFSYVVNFMMFPIGPENTSENVIAFYSGHCNIPLANYEYNRLMVFSPRSDTECFHVLVVNNKDEAFKFDWELENNSYKRIDTKLKFIEPIITENPIFIKSYQFQVENKSKTNWIWILMAILIAIGVLYLGFLE